MVGVNTQVQEQRPSLSSIPGRSVYGPRTQQLITQGVLEEFPVRIVDLLLETPAYGLEFLEDFLAIAQIESGTPKTPARFAFCCVQNVRELAEGMGRGYDTVHKYVILFCALGLLQKYRYQHKVILQFPLHGYIFPESLEELDKLVHKSRSRVQSLAARIKTRCLELQMIDQEISSSSSALPQISTKTPPALTRSSTPDAPPANGITSLPTHTTAHEGKTPMTGITSPQDKNRPTTDFTEKTLLREMHEYTAECAREKRQSTIPQRSDLFAALVTQILLNDQSCYEKFAPRLHAGEILHIAIINDKKDQQKKEKCAEDEILATCDIYPQYIEPGFPINRYAWEYLGYDPQFQGVMFCDNRQTYHPGFSAINGQNIAVEPVRGVSDTDMVSTPPQEAPVTFSAPENEPSTSALPQTEISSPSSSPDKENDDVLYEEFLIPASMPQLRERWLKDGRIVERLDTAGVLRTYKVCRRQAQQEQPTQEEPLSVQQTYSQADEPSTRPTHKKYRKRQIFNADSAGFSQKDENGAVPQALPSQPAEVTKPVSLVRQPSITNSVTRPGLLEPIAHQISIVKQTIQSQREEKRSEQEQVAPSEQHVPSDQKKSLDGIEEPRAPFLTPAIQQPEPTSSTIKAEEATETRVTLPEHLIPQECWDREFIAECERTYKPVPGDKLDFTYDELHDFQKVYVDFPEAETFLEVDAYRDWHVADFDADFLQEFNTLNVITFIKYIINNKNNIQKRNTFITFLVSVFDKSLIHKEKSAGYYYQLFKNDFHPDVISCAFLSTLLAMYSKGRETIEKPGAIFIKTCQTLQKKVNEEGHIPYTDLKAARKFGNFTCVDLAIALHDNLVLDGVTERLSIYLGVTFAKNACYKSQKIADQRKKDRQEAYSVEQGSSDQPDDVYDQTRFSSSKRRVS